MSPLEIEILLHYHYTYRDFRDGDFSALAVQAALQKFVNEDLLVSCPVVKGQESYRITERGIAHVRALCDLPLPAQVVQTPVGPLPDWVALNRAAITKSLCQPQVGTLQLVWKNPAPHAAPPQQPSMFVEMDAYPPLCAPTGNPPYEWTEAERRQAGKFARELTSREAADVAVGPGTPIYRLTWLLSELEKRFPEAHNSFSSEPAELKYLEAIDQLLIGVKNA